MCYIWSWSRSPWKHHTPIYPQTNDSIQKPPALHSPTSSISAKSHACSLGSLDATTNLHRFIDRQHQIGLVGVWKISKRTPAFCSDSGWFGKQRQQHGSSSTGWRHAFVATAAWRLCASHSTSSGNRSGKVASSPSCIRWLYSRSVDWPTTVNL